MVRRRGCGSAARLLSLALLASVAAAARVEVPFARAALFAADLPEVRACDDGLTPSCADPHGAMAAWRYATNNLRRAVDLLPEEQRRAHKSTVSWVALVSAEVGAFFEQPTAETLAAATGNARQVFDALRSWMEAAPPSLLEVPESAGVGVGFLPGGRSLRLAAHPDAGPWESEVRLANGVEMPVLGFGTWQLLGASCYAATLAALRAGYRHIDTAQAYANEADVGRALADSGVPRRAVFLATKLSEQADYSAARLKGRFAAQLRDLRTDYVDLYMLHSPGSGNSTQEAWRVMERLYDEGKIRALGVSNFNAGALADLLSWARVQPVYVQNKFSIYSPGDQNDDASIMDYLRKTGIVMMGYSVINPWPSAMPPMTDPHVVAIARRVGRTSSQVLHRWALQLGAGVIPRSGNVGRIEENARLFDFELSDVDMRLLCGLVTLSQSTSGSLSPRWMEDVYGLGVGVRGVSA